MINPESIVVVAKGQISTDLAEEAVILNVDSGVYYGLDAVGARVWSLVQEPRKVQELKEILVKEYDVTPDQCERDLVDLLGRLHEAGLIEVNGRTRAT